MLNISKSLAAQNRAEKLIPGKTQLLSKRPEMFAPGVWPGYYTKAKGQEIWDLDGNKYFDFSIAGIGANVLGYSHEEVDEAVKRAISNGSSSSLNCFEEIELGETLVRLHPWAGMVRYARSGGEAVSIAIRIARAKANRDVILFCGYHGWSDWYLSSNIANGDNLSEHLLAGLSPKGVPVSLEGTAIPFSFNDFDQLKSLVQANTGKVAAIIMEPYGSTKPAPGYLESVRELATRAGISLIFDEISSGFRLNAGGVHLTLGVNPDVAIFSKAISNGYPMSVILGTEEFMQSAQETFISSTSWTERIGPTAAIATIKNFEATHAEVQLSRIGDIIVGGWRGAASEVGLELSVSGFSCLTKFHFIHDQDTAMRTYFTQEMLERGFLASGRFYAMAAHREEQAHEYVKHTVEIFSEIKYLVDNGKLLESLRGPIAHNGFQRLNA